jgi:hypothetical protein
MARPQQLGDPPSDPASRLWWAGPAVAVILLALFGMFFGREPEKVDYGTSYDASDGGLRASFLLLEELGYPVERSRRLTGGDIRWLVFPTKMNDKEAAALDGWIRRGGIALLALGDSDLADKLKLNATVENPLDRPPEGELAFPISRRFKKGNLYEASAPDVSRVAAGDLQVNGPAARRTWGSLNGRPLVSIYSRDQGQIWLLRRPDVLANGNLRTEDNAVLVCRLADAMLEERHGGRIAFDEFCHGLRERPSVVELLFRPPVLGVTLQCVLLLALVLWQSVVRFGPVDPPPSPARRSKEEFLDAMAELLARNGDRASAFRTLRDDLRRRLERSLGLPADTPTEALVKEAVRRRGLPAEPLQQLLEAEAPPGGRGPVAFLQAAATLESLAHDATRTRPR